MIIKTEELTGDLLCWVWDNLDRETYRMVLNETNDGLVGYEFDNEDDITLLTLKFSV